MYRNFEVTHKIDDSSSIVASKEPKLVMDAYRIKFIVDKHRCLEIVPADVPLIAQFPLNDMNHFVSIINESISCLAIIQGYDLHIQLPVVMVSEKIIDERGDATSLWWIGTNHC
jgi:hypothetical protein